MYRGKVHVLIERRLATSSGFRIVFYTACGRLLMGKKHAQQPFDVTCLACKRTSYAVWWWKHR